MDTQHDINRRRFLRTAGATAAAGSVLGGSGNSAPIAPAAVGDKPALLGGSPVREGAGPSWEAVGVARNAKYRTVTEEPRHMVYLPYATVATPEEQLQSMLGNLQGKAANTRLRRAKQLGLVHPSFGRRRDAHDAAE